MRLLIAGWQGQLARALVELAPGAPDITALAVGRPALDLCEPASITRAMTDFRPDVIINTAAYTAVDKAEREPHAAFALNRDGARMLAAAAARRGAAIIHISTAYVFDGAKAEPYREDDATGPVSTYGRSRLEGEAAVMAANQRHVIVRTSWVHSATGQNFVRSMLARAAKGERELRIVGDQLGQPTYAPHLADAVLAIARLIAAGRQDLWGLHHAAGAGSASWADLAEAVFAAAVRRGGPGATVTRIASADYPTAAPRPRNARLDCARLAALGITLPAWERGVEEGVARILASSAIG